MKNFTTGLNPSALRASMMPHLPSLGRSMGSLNKGGGKSIKIQLPGEHLPRPSNPHMRGLKIKLPSYP